MRILPALVLSLILVFSVAAPAVAVKGGSSGGKSSSSKFKSDGDDDDGGDAGGDTESDDGGGGCGSGTWIAFPILGGTVLVTRRRRRGIAS